MAKVELKQPVVDEISSLIDGAQSIVLVDYQGLTVDDETKLRKSLREAGVTYKVYKNTLIKRAIKDTPYESVSDLLNGPTAVAVSKEDATAPARVLCEAAKKNEKLEIKGGIIEGKYCDPAAVGEIAKIPSREELLGRLLGSIKSPIANFARVIKQIAEKQDGGEGEDAAPEAAAEPAPEA